MAVSGAEGCGKASTPEIDCLLSGLQNPSDVCPFGRILFVLKNRMLMHFVFIK